MICFFFGNATDDDDEDDGEGEGEGGSGKECDEEEVKADRLVAVVETFDVVVDDVDDEESFDGVVKVTEEEVFLDRDSLFTEDLGRDAVDFGLTITGGFETGTRAIEGRDVGCGGDDGDESEDELEDDDEG